MFWKEKNIDDKAILVLEKFLCCIEGNVEMAEFHSFPEKELRNWSSKGTEFPLFTSDEIKWGNGYAS